MKIRYARVTVLALTFCWTAAAQPLELAPGKTVIVAGSDRHEREAAQLLQAWMRRATGAADGYALVAAADVPEDALILSVGRTDHVADVDVGKLYQHGFVIQRKDHGVAILGGAPMGTFYGAVHFLDAFCNVRFYMPGDLWTSASGAERIVVGDADLRIEPYVKSNSASGYWSTLASDRSEGAWTKRTAMNRRMGGSHQHTMWARFGADRYGKSHPGIYPIVNGKRYIPENARDQNWQPCLTEPALVDIAVQEARTYFAEHPDYVFISYSIQDKRVQCQCERCQAAYKAVKAKLPEDAEGVQAQRMAYSDVYWTFMNQVAKRLETDFPDKMIVGIAYSDVRTPPSFPLRPNVCAWKVHKLSDLIIDRAFTTDSIWTQWAAKAQHFGHHDWAHGRGYYIPRFYEHLAQMGLQYYDRLGTPHVFTHVESYPNWGLDGPKYYIRSRLHWDIGTNIDGILRNFCDDMFGPAAEPMYTYWNTIERLYISLNMTRERKLHRWNTQFLTTPEQMKMVHKCRALLDKAATLAKTDAQQKRVELFSKTFWLSQRLFEMQAADSVSQTEIDALWTHVNEKLIPDPLTIFRPAYKDGWQSYIPEQLTAAIKTVTKGKVK